ncbi:elongation factor 1-beta' [Procambarus clarkii]|uniref:elongation factor 1-beta' n=1 Tax=Procambarus clarkii TaxID=6728 RepID=UPI0037430721
MEFFGDVTTSCGLQILNDYLQDRSYIHGFTPSKTDAEVFSSLANVPEEHFCHALRWYNHIQSFSVELKLTFGGNSASTNDLLQNAALIEEVVINSSDLLRQDKDMTSSEINDVLEVIDTDDEDEFDLFCSDDDDEDQEAARIRDERLRAYAEKKLKKPSPVAKSSIMLDVKPWDDETDMKTMEELVRSIKMDGLQWGASKLAPLAFSINKLSILCIVEDEKVSVDDLIEKIYDFQDTVQSVDIAAFNKI